MARDNETPFEGSWVSVEEVEVNKLDINNNFSNWTNFCSTKGYILFKVKLDSIHNISYAQLDIPVINFDSGKNDYYTLHLGSLHYNQTQIKIGEHFTIKYSIRILNHILTLHLFNTSIDFKLSEQ